MDFFRKSKSKTESKVPVDAPSQATEPTPKAQESGTPLDAAREAFRARYGGEMPAELLTLFKQLAKTEAKLLGTTHARLDQQELSRTREALRLCEAKRANTKSLLKKINEQLNWYDEYVRITQELSANKTKLYASQNELSAAFAESQLLKRYEALSPGAEPFFRALILAEEVESDKQTQGDYSTEVATRRQTATQMEQQLQDAVQRRESAEQEMEARMPLLYKGFHTTGVLEQLRVQVEQERLSLADVSRELQEARKQKEECQTNLQQLRKQKEEYDNALQSMEAHVPMLRHGEAIQEKLNQLYQLNQDLEVYQHAFDEYQRKQAEANETLNTLFRANQENDSDIQTNKNELIVHQQNNKGIDGYALQRRTSELNIQLQLLKTAQHVWRRITDGYNFIEEKEQDVIRQQIHYDQTGQTLAHMEQEISKLKSICEEQKYAFTLSKSENISALRGDLREGTCCSVCGATHHPYHSETEMALGEIIKSLKTEYEQTNTELLAKTETFAHMQQNYAREGGTLSEERKALQNVRLQLNRDKEEWATFAVLGHSLADCSHTVNREARQIMIQQLIEKFTQDVEKSEKDLNTFNFHQQNINRIVEHLAKLETEKRDNTLRLNEVNTSCQVLANNIEQLQTVLFMANRTYRQRYEEAEGLITLPLWHSEWKSSHEGFKLKIQSMMEAWQDNKEKLQQATAQVVCAQAALDNAKDIVERREQEQLRLTQSQQALQEQIDAEVIELRHDFGETTPESIFQQLWQNIRRSMQAENEIRMQCMNGQKTLYKMEGAQENIQVTRVAKEQRLVESRSKLDLWLHHFNASNPPAQVPELKRMFITEADWGKRRQHIRQMQDQLLLLQHDVDKARETLVVHQGRALSPEDKDEESRDALQFRQEEVEKQLDELSVQCATLKARIRAHEQSVERTALYEKDIERNLEA